MKKPLILMLVSGVVLILILVVSALKEKLHYPDFLETIFHEAVIGLFVTFLTGLVAWLLSEHIEKISSDFGQHFAQFGPVIESGFKGISQDIRGSIDGSLNTMNLTIANGFSFVASALSMKVHEVSESWKGLTDNHVKEDLLAAVKSPAVKKLISEGQITEAVARLDEIYVKNENQEKQQASSLHEQVAVLLLSRDEKDWIKALKLFDENEALQFPKYFLTLAYRFWSVKQVEKAIELSERGLEIAKHRDPQLLPRLENSLAYYYADAERPDKEAVAREFAMKAVQARPREANPLDTLGFVKIIYGKTQKEIIEGVELCHKAVLQGGSFEGYSKHVARANIRLTQVSK